MIDIKKYIRGTLPHKLYWKFKKYRYDCKQNVKIKKFQKDGLELLTLFANTLNAAEIDYWLDFGTLLGYYREHDFIKHDNDLDFGAYIEDAEKIRKVLISVGFELVRNYWVVGEDGKEDCFRFNDSTVDVFYYKKNGNKLIGNSFNPLKTVKLNEIIPFQVMQFIQPYSGLKRDLFLGVEVKVPKNADEYLRANYGDDYMIPNPKFNWMTDSPNLTTYSYNEKKGEGIIKMKYQ